MRAPGDAASNHPPGDVIRSYRDRIVECELQRRAHAEAIQDIYSEAPGNDLNKAALRELVKRELETPEKRDARENAEAALDSMLAALAALDDDPAPRRSDELPIATFDGPGRPQ